MWRKKSCFLGTHLKEQSTEQKITSIIGHILQKKNKKPKILENCLFNRCVPCTVISRATVHQSSVLQQSIVLCLSPGGSRAIGGWRSVIICLPPGGSGAVGGRLAQPSLHPSHPEATVHQNISHKLCLQQCKSLQNPVYFFVSGAFVNFSVQCSYCLIVLKGQCHEIFCFQFFSRISFPPAPEYPIRIVSNFFENSRRYSQVKVHTGINDNDGRIAAGNNDTGRKFTAGKYL